MLMAEMKQYEQKKMSEILTGLVQRWLDVVDGELPLSEEGEVALEHQHQLLAVPVLQHKHQALQM